jgi:hypothetical protein
MWNIARCIHIKRKNRLAKPTVEETVCSHDNLVLKKTMMERNKNVVVWDSQTVITEPDEQGVDDLDEEDPKKMISHRKIKINFVSDTGRLTAVVSWQLSSNCRTTDSCGN